jgi:hypothetical protein
MASWVASLVRCTIASWYNAESPDAERSTDTGRARVTGESSGETEHQRPNSTCEHIEQFSAADAPPSTRESFPSVCSDEDPGERSSRKRSYKDLCNELFGELEDEEDADDNSTKTTEYFRSREQYRRVRLDPLQREIDAAR